MTKAKFDTNSCIIYFTVSPSTLANYSELPDWDGMMEIHENEIMNYFVSTDENKVIDIARTCARYHTAYAQLIVMASVELETLAEGVSHSLGGNGPGKMRMIYQSHLELDLRRKDLMKDRFPSEQVHN